MQMTFGKVRAVPGHFPVTPLPLLNGSRQRASGYRVPARQYYNDEVLHA